MTVFASKKVGGQHALRLATIDDAAAIWDWRNSIPSEHLIADRHPSIQEHLSWFEHALLDPKRRLYVSGTPPIAHLRLDLSDANTAAVSIVLDPSVRGQGVGQRLLASMTDLGRDAGINVLTAQVYFENAASVALFSKAGYTQSGPTDGLCNFKLEL
jgi:RimJ/RimL family protein N-acetyltransferase